jgi:hypothetical protein
MKWAAITNLIMQGKRIPASSWSLYYSGRSKKSKHSEYKKNLKSISQLSTFEEFLEH